ncbi:MAG: EF-P lysine aminoacylase EpmA, partial [bacterium]
RKRAELLQKVRTFFQDRGVLEVETPSIARCPSIDLHLESQTVTPAINIPIRYLITSPEYHMKRLLCAGSGSIFQVCKAFRQDETGQRHNPEFTMIEWYRVDWDHWRLMEEVEALLQALLDCGKADRFSYGEAFQIYTGQDPFNLTSAAFRKCCADNSLSPPRYLMDDTISRDEWLNFLFGVLIEPHLGHHRPVFITDYPASQATLSRINPNNEQLSERFELFYKGMELGNGFHELKDAKEQATRFERENRLRAEAGKAVLPVDEAFLEALDHGLPDCAGIALGFDRIVMLALGQTSIDDVLTFPWDRA